MQADNPLRRDRFFRQIEWLTSSSVQVTLLRTSDIVECVIDIVKCTADIVKCAVNTVVYS